MGPCRRLLSHCFVSNSVGAMLRMHHRLCSSSLCCLSMERHFESMFGSLTSHQVISMLPAFRQRRQHTMGWMFCGPFVLESGASLGSLHHVQALIPSIRIHAHATCYDNIAHSTDSIATCNFQHVVARYLNA